MHVANLVASVYPFETMTENQKQVINTKKCTLTFFLQLESLNKSVIENANSESRQAFEKKSAVL